MTVYAPLPQGLLSLLRQVVVEEFMEIMNGLSKLAFMGEFPSVDGVAKQ